MPKKFPPGFKRDVALGGVVFGDVGEPHHHTEDHPVIRASGGSRLLLHFVRRQRLDRGELAEAALTTAAVVGVDWSSPARSSSGSSNTATLRGQFEDVAAMLEKARDDLLAFSAFHVEHWRKLWSTNPLERLHREVKRRCGVVGVFPNDAAIDRLVTAVIVETHDEWVADRRYLSETSMARLRASSEDALPVPTRTQRRLVR